VPERENGQLEPQSEEASSYEAPVVEDIESLDGPAVTAALASVS